MSSITVNDVHYGVLTIDVSAERGVVEVSGEQVPTVVIRRSPDAEASKYIPIGTRNATHLSMSVGGVAAELRPGKGRLTRRSYRIELTVAGTEYKSTPGPDEDAVLSRDGVKLGSFELDEADGEFTVHWLTEGDEVQPSDAAIGYALSAAFRTRTTGIISLLANGSESVPW
ncbi:hypothetical protein ACPZ19_48755 [Amycolatopsis lurida]